MTTQRNIAVLIGSLRKDSISVSLARALKNVVPPNLALEIVPIGDMPFYNPDLEEKAPASWLNFRHAVAQSDAILFITPEYNRSVPAVLKNAIDVGSRPYGMSVWNGKPAAIITLSPGTLGGFGANHHLRQSLVCLNVRAMPAPEIYLAGGNELLDEDGAIKRKESEAFLSDAMKKFSDWINLTSHMKA
jgi:chromate reductase